MKKLILALVLVCLTACGGSKSPTGPTFTNAVQYKVSASGGAAQVSLTYQNDSGGTAQFNPFLLPWIYTFQSVPKAGDFLYVSVQNGTSSGCVTAEIYRQDVLFKTTQSCGAFVIATSSGSY